MNLPTIDTSLSQLETENDTRRAQHEKLVLDAVRAAGNAGFVVRVFQTPFDKRRPKMGFSATNVDVRKGRGMYQREEAARQTLAKQLQAALRAVEGAER